MGEIENSYKKRKVKKDIQKAILMSVKAIGFLSVALLAPNAVKVLKNLGFTLNNRENESIKRSRDRLIKLGLLKYEKNTLSLTEKGLLKIHRLEAEEWRLNKPKKWDKKWRVLIFDIPEKRKNIREKVRYSLIAIGFIRLQDSVWIYPYPCDDLINLLKADFKVGKDLLYMIVDSIENDATLIKSFNL
jgi:DNA-binding transcriptional regulator PaaX